MKLKWGSHVKTLKKKYKTSLKKKVEDSLTDYCVNTTLHGLKYVGMSSLSVTERLFFGFSFILVVCLSGYFISNVYMKWIHTPMIIGLNPELSLVKDFPFPAVTICNMNQAKQSFVEHINPDSVQYTMLTTLCQHKELVPSANKSIYSRWRAISQFIQSASQPCREMIQLCRYASVEEKCMDMISSIMTDDGLCCTFNSLSPKMMFQNATFEGAIFTGSYADSQNYFWTPERGYVAGTRFNVRPRRIAGAGIRMGLTVVLYANVDDYYCSSTNSFGFKVLLHNPVETPKISNFGFFIGTETETQISVTPTMYYASQAVFSLSKEVRQCIFENESKLEFFSVYTKLNCEMECEARLTDLNCGCVQMYMPKVNGDSRICDQRDALCFEDIRYKIDYTGDQSLICDCLPACFEVEYAKELASSPLGDGNFYTENFYLKLNDSENRRNLAVLHIFFKEASFRAYTKTEFIGFTEFLSSVGGLLGLFMGFSVLSVIEIFYYISLRPYMMYRPAHNRVNVKPKRGVNIITPPNPTTLRKIDSTIFHIAGLPVFGRKKDDHDDDDDGVIVPYCN